MDKQALGLLKSFTQINNSFILNSELIGVMTPDKSICTFWDAKGMDEFGPRVEMDGDEEVVIGAKIYNVSEFLNVFTTLGDNTQVKMKDKYIELKNGNQKLKYALAGDGIIKEVKNTIESNFENIENNIEVDINTDILIQIKKMGGLLSLDTVSFIGKDGNCVIELTNEVNDNNYFIKLDNVTHIDDIKISFGLESFSKIVDGDYKVEISEQGLMKLSSKTVEGLRYYVASI